MMIDFFLRLYSSTNHSNIVLKYIRYDSMLRFLIRWSANLILPLYFVLSRNKIKYCSSNKLLNDRRVIVSLTSFPQRINRVWLVVENILRQTITPDIVCLWLSKEQFQDMKEIPNNLLRLQKYGLQIKLVDGDLRSHKKYYYAFKEFSRDLVVTIDDDLFYSSDFIYKCLQMHIKYPHSVIANYGYFLQYDFLGKLLPYNKWKSVFAEYRSIDELFFGSGGGTLFPVGLLYKDVLNKELFLKYCFYADDIWLNTMCYLSNTEIIIMDNSHILLPVINLRSSSLCELNQLNSMNDLQIEGVRTYYKNLLQVDPFSKYKTCYFEKE